MGTRKPVACQTVFRTVTATLLLLAHPDGAAKYRPHTIGIDTPLHL
jgi:hypothetical protein